MDSIERILVRRPPDLKFVRTSWSVYVTVWKTLIPYWSVTCNYIFSTFLWPKNAWRRNPSLTLYLIGGVFFCEISLFSKSLTRLPQAQITANVCSLTQPKMAFKYLNLLIIRNQLTVHSNRSLSRGLQTIWGAKRTFQKFELKMLIKR